MTSAPAFARLLDPGDPVPWVRARLLGGDADFPFEKLGGRHVLLLLFGSATLPAAADALNLARAAERLFAAGEVVFIGVSVDASDMARHRIAPGGPLHFLRDEDRAVSLRFGAAEAEGTSYRPHWLLIEPGLRVAARFALADGARAIEAAAAARAAANEDAIAPILQVPRVLEPALCQELVAFHEREGGTDSGVMRQVGDRTVMVIDHDHKRRSDCEITDERLRQALSHRVVRRLVPAIRHAFQFEATRIERYIVACYDHAEGGHFNPHRDNTTLGTAHRRFAVTINLNEDYEGGDLHFPEFGPRTYRAAPGGAVVFSCSMLHEATPVTRGRRYATLPFLYDEAAAAVRQANLGSLTPAEAPAAG